MTRKELDELILDTLRQVVRLLSIDTTRGLPRGEQILMLQRAGLQPREIAEALGIKPNAVSVALYQSKRRPKKEARDSGEEHSD
jgi:DNA-directed RNA polymerase specialized sigma24 family protein